MRRIRQFCAISILTSILSIPAFAGDMGFPGVTAPSEETPPTQTAAGDMQTPSAAAGSVMEVALGFLLDVSSLV